MSPSPPAPFADFDYAFDPALSNLFPHTLPLPSSADLFSPAETTDLLGFLDNFGSFLDPTPPPTTSNQKTRSARGSVHPPDPDARDASDSSSTTQKGADAHPRAKPLLSTPQKRLNHIMSEQKRRNAIRDGYAQLISLLAPAGTDPGIGMPTRGRPKGSGTRGKRQSKGKSGVLFRAVEYCRWLEEGRDALRDEVLRLEAAAENLHSS